MKYLWDSSTKEEKGKVITFGFAPFYKENLSFHFFYFILSVSFVLSFFMPPAPRTNYYIIDGNSYLYRAFFAIPKFTTKNGLVTNAIFGFFKMLLKLIADKHCHEIIVVFDHKGKSFRHEEYKEYKEHREKMPDELIGQISYIQQLVQLLGLPMLVIEGVEADDTIATLVTTLRTHPEHHIYMITGDKDMMQLVGENVFIFDTMKNIIYNREKVKEKMGVFPEKIIDLLGLMGDSADNIPGVPGVGPKTAVDLLSTYDSVEDIIAHRNDLKGKLVEKFTDFEEQALLSKKLATVKNDVDISHIDLTMTPPDVEALVSLAKELEFHSLLREIETLQQHQETITPTLPKQELPTITYEEISTLEALQKHVAEASICALYYDREKDQCFMNFDGMVYHIEFLSFAQDFYTFIEHMSTDSKQYSTYGLKHLEQRLMKASTLEQGQLSLFA